MTGFTGHHSGGVSVNVTATGIAFALFFGWILAGPTVIPVRINDTTFVVKYINVIKVCSVATLSCKSMSD